MSERDEQDELGTAIAQVAGRPPAMCAMKAMTIDALAGGGRMIVGLGVSGPQIVEGWYGQPWGTPYWRVRDYVEIMRKIFRRAGPVSHEGREIAPPYTGEGATGLGKPLRSRASSGRVTGSHGTPSHLRLSSRLPPLDPPHDPATDDPGSAARPGPGSAFHSSTITAATDRP